MCTVTFLPLSNNSFLLTHNRDEHHTRSIALLPQHYHVGDQQILYPKDEQGGGTWIATNRQFTLCLLNGGFEKHIPTPPYRHSRGLIIPDFFTFNHLQHFISDYAFHDIEPFTLIVIEHEGRMMHELVFDGHTLNVDQKDSNGPNIWSSSSLYSVDQRLRRKKMFELWVQQQSSFSRESIIQFHKQKYDDTFDEGIMINRSNILQTVSLSAISKIDQQAVSFLYEDFLQEKMIHIEI